MTRLKLQVTRTSEWKRFQCAGCSFRRQQSIWRAVAFGLLVFDCSLTNSTVNTTYYLNTRHFHKRQTVAWETKLEWWFLGPKNLWWSWVRKFIGIRQKPEKTNCRDCCVSNYATWNSDSLCAERDNQVWTGIQFYLICFKMYFIYFFSNKKIH